MIEKTRLDVALNRLEPLLLLSGLFAVFIVSGALFAFEENSSKSSMAFLLMLACGIASALLCIHALKRNDETDAESAKPDPSIELQSPSVTAPQTGQSKEGITTMTESNSTPISTHPLAGNVSAFQSWLGFLAISVAAYVVFGILTGADLGNGVAVGSVTVPWEAFIVAAAFLIYRHQNHVSLVRPSTYFYSTLDFLGSAAVFVVAAVGIASWYPPVQTFLTALGLPVAVYSSLTLVTAATFVWFSMKDIARNHIFRAHYGKQAVVDQSVKEGAIPAVEARPAGRQEAGNAQVTMHFNAPITIHNMVVADPAQGVKMMPFQPRLAAENGVATQAG